MKLIFLLMVYFAGFATAVYILVPVPENQASPVGAEGVAPSSVKSGEFLQSFSAGMHKCVDFGKAAAWRAAKLIKQKLEDRRSQTDS